MALTTQKLSFEEYLTYEDGTDTRYELVNGELVAMSLGTGRHGAIAEFLYDQFRAIVKQQALPWTAKQMIVAVRSPRGGRWDTCRIPDITVLSEEQWEEMAEREAVINLNELPPLLVVEVVSPSTKMDDYRSKQSEYSVLNIPEYWIVDPIESKVTIGQLDHGLYNLTEYQGEHLINSPTFPHLQLTASQILAAKL